MLNRETWEETRKAGTRDRETTLADSREKRDLVMSKIREGYLQAEGFRTDASHMVAGDRNDVFSAAVLEFALPLLQANGGR
jgi:hypothetical protein